VFDVGIIKIILKLLLIGSNLFSLKFLISKFWQFFFVVYIIFSIYIFFPIFFPTRIAKLGKLKTKKTCCCRPGGGGGGGGGVIF